jgi:HAMP domain-containing protein
MDILVKVDAALDNPALKTLPANLDATLEGVNAAVQSFNRLTASLTSATGMVDKEVPETLSRVRRLADAYAALAAQFERDLESLRGVVGPNTATMLEFTHAAHELGEAAKAVRGLAGQLERNPESLLLGKGAVRK